MYKGGLGDTHIRRVERKGRDGEQDSVIEQDRGMERKDTEKQRYWEEERTSGRERQGWGAGEREVENEKTAMVRRIEMQRIKNYFQAAGQRDRARGKKKEKQQGEGWVTHSRTLRE